MEYRKGQSLVTHNAIIGDGKFPVTLTETTEAFRLNGVTFSRAKLARWTKGNASIQMFAEMVSTTWPIIMDPRITWKDKEAEKYIAGKLHRMYASVGVDNIEKHSEAADFCHAFAKLISDVTGDKTLLLRMANIAARMLAKQDNGLDEVIQALIKAIGGNADANISIVNLDEMLKGLWPPKDKLN